MPRIQSIRDLIAWQKSVELADMVYDLTEHFRITHGLARSLNEDF